MLISLEGLKPASEKTRQDEKNHLFLFRLEEIMGKLLLLFSFKNKQHYVFLVFCWMVSSEGFILFSDNVVLRGNRL